jgi:hypothetical protein
VKFREESKFFRPNLSEYTVAYRSRITSSPARLNSSNHLNVHTAFGPVSAVPFG